MGRIKRTVGTKNSYLHDFIEPVYNIYWDFDRNEEEFYFDGNDELIELENILMELLCYTIKKEYDSNNIVTKRVKYYIEQKSSKEISSKESVKLFVAEINQAFKNSDMKQIRFLYKVL